MIPIKPSDATWTDEQWQAIWAKGQDMLVSAAAGSGKTAVLINRMIEKVLDEKEPISVDELLVVTFTNASAAEMRHRIESLAGLEARNSWMGTFRSVFAKILRVEAPKIGYPSNFTIYDSDDSKSLIRTIVKEMRLDDKV